MKIGDRFTKLTVISNPFVIDGTSRVECRCDCGKTKTVRVQHLKGSKTGSCGCSRKEITGRGAKERYRIEVGDKFARLTVLSKGWKYFTDTMGRPTRVEICTVLCDCGTVKEGVIKHNLIKGKTLSCGCLATERGKARRKRDKAGDKIGVFTLLEFLKEARTRKGDLWRARCSCGTEKSISVNSMLATTSCLCNRSKHVGVTYNSLTILSIFNKDKNQYALCRCSCGQEKVIRASSVYKGITHTCGHRRNSSVSIKSTRAV